MKAIIENGITYRVIEVRGSYVYTDNRGKIKLFRTEQVSIVEVEDIPIKTKTINKKKLAEKLYVTGPSREMTRQERQDVLDRMERRKWGSISW